jgi:CelD/BcsL family acetyltransferase involved in cellulose biosynthesis
MRETSGLSFRILRDEASLVAIQAEWEDLFRRAAVRTPFLRYTWAQLSWHRQRLDQTVTPFIVLVRDGGRLVVIAPLVARRSRYFFLNLSFLHSLTAQYSDVLVEDSARTPEYISYLWATICKLRYVRRLRFDQIRDDSLLTPHLVGSRIRVKETDPAPFIDLVQFGDWDTFFRSLSKKLRTDHRRQIRHLEGLGALKLRLATDETLFADITWLFAAKRQWLKRTQLVSDWLSAPGTEQLFAAAAAEGLDSGRTWLTVLTLNGTTIAANLSFREDRTLFVSKIAYDFEWQLYSPGRTLTLLTLERAFKEGLMKCDLMLGEGWKRTIAKERVGVANKTVKFHLL